MTTGGPGSPERLTPADQRNVSASSVSNGGVLAYLAGSPGEIWTLPLNGDRKPQRFLKGPFSLSHPAISPDGRWMAYRSDETGRGEVYVQPFPGPGGKTRVSLDGGTEPVWSKNGRELFFTKSFPPPATEGITMMVVDMDTTRGLAPSPPRALFSGLYGFTGPIASYDVSADSRRFIVMKVANWDQKPVTQIEVALNWSETLNRLVPTK